MRVSDEMHLVWDGGLLEVGDVIEVEVAEFDEASATVWEEKHCCPTQTASDDTDNPKEWGKQAGGVTAFGKKAAQ